MIGKLARLGTYTISALILAGASFAHPGHDHAHSDHAVYDVDAGASSDGIWIVFGLIGAVFIVSLIRRHQSRDKS